MAYTNTVRKINARRIKLLLTPSWISSLLCFIFALAITGSVIVTFNFNNSQYKALLLSYEHPAKKESALTLPGQNPPGNTDNTLQNTWPLIAFWAMVGLIVYFVGEFLLKAVFHAAEYTSEFNYLHANRSELILNGLFNLIISVGGAIVWLIFLDIFLKRIIPEAIYLAHQSITASTTLNTIEYASKSFLLVAFATHINIIFLRLVLRRPRIFSSADYSDV